MIVGLQLALVLVVLAATIKGRRARRTAWSWAIYLSSLTLGIVTLAISLDDLVRRWGEDAAAFDDPVGAALLSAFVSFALVARSGGWIAYRLWLRSRRENPDSMAG